MPATLTHQRPDAAERRSRGERTTTLFETLARCDDPAERRRVLEEVVTLNLAVADSLAGKYVGRGVPLEDLVQVARLSLIRVARSFSLDRECDFLAYAVPSIRGALKRHFRDAGWTVRPPRRVQEAQLRMNAARPVLTQSLGREPTVAEVAAASGLDEETVIEVLAVDTCYSPDSLDRPRDPFDDGGATVASFVGLEEPGFELLEHRVVLGPVIRRLPERDRLVLELRFGQGLTQKEVGEAIGVSQMQVSRILSRILTRLRREITDGD
jgi:RNA polymerase sigma-B factor